MSQEKRLSLSFGDFACDIVGYDDPFTILNRVMELFTEVSKTTSWVAGDGQKAKEVTRSRFAERITKTAANYDLHIDEMDGRFVVSKRDTNEVVAEGDVAAATDTAEARPEPATVAETTEHTDVISEEIDVVVSDEAAAAPTADTTETTEVENPADAAADHETAAASHEDVVADEEAEVSAEAPTAEAESEPPTAETDAEEVAAAIAAASEQPAEPDATHAAEEPSTPRRRRLRLNAATATETPGPKTEETSESAPAESPKAEPAASEKRAPRRPRIVIDQKRSQPYRKPNLTRPDSNTSIPGDSFALPQQPTTSENANYASGLQAKVTSTTNADEISSAEATSDEAPLVLSEPMKDAAPAHEEPLLLDTPVSKPAAEAPAETADDDENLFFFDDIEPALPAKAAPAVAPKILADQEAPKAEAPPEAPKKKGFGFGLFRRRKQTSAEEKPEELHEKASADDAAFDRLREAAHADLPDLEISPKARNTNAPKLFSVSGGDTHEDASSPAAFARQVGASSLQDLLEASAAYMAIVEGKAKFSRNEVMTALTEIGPEKDYSPEARLKSFRRLITLGAIVQSDDGMFTISHATRFGYENQLRA